MDEVAAALVLTALLTCGFASVLTRTATWAWLLAVFSALWPPLNDGAWEGPVLFAVDPDHGITVADLLAVSGFLIAGWRLWQLQPAENRSRRVAGLTALALAGIAAAYAHS